MRRTATEPRSRATTTAACQLTHAAHACEALRRIQCAKTRRTAARICESAAACARHVESAPSHARAAGLVNSRAQPRARPATAATAAQVLQLRAMRHESMPRTAGASLARTAALACACACHRQSGWESRARRRSQAPRCSSAARFATSPRQAAKQRRATLIGLKASSSHAWPSRVGNGWARARMARPSETLGRPSGGTQACEEAAQLCDAPGAWSHQWPAITLQVGGARAGATRTALTT